MSIEYGDGVPESIVAQVKKMEFSAARAEYYYRLAQLSSSTPLVEVPISGPSSPTDSMKPVETYMTLIAKAILSKPEGNLSFEEICSHILENFPYFQSHGAGWRNSVQMNLDLCLCFLQMANSTDGKDSTWVIHPSNLEDFIRGDFNRKIAEEKVHNFNMGVAAGLNLAKNIQKEGDIADITKATADIDLDKQDPQYKIEGDDFMEDWDII